MISVRQRSRRRILAVPATVLLGLLLSAAPAAAVVVDPTYGAHSGKTGVHTLIDSWEFPATCKYGADHFLDKIQVRRPIVFAYNRTDGIDVQKVSWQYTVEYQDVMAAGGPYEDWADFYVSPVMKADATDQKNASFDPQTFTFTSDPIHTYYRVSIRMRWYYPTNSVTDGSAVHVTYNYLLKGGGLDNPSGGRCPGSAGPPTSAAPHEAPSPDGMVVVIDPSYGPHTGNRGVHQLIDSYEFPTVCKYDASTHKIKKIQIRRPIVFAFDRTNHLDMEKVGWRYRIEYLDFTSSGKGYQDYPDLYVSPLMKAKATDADNAAFLPQTYTFTSNPTHAFYRVSIEMRWYYPTSTQTDGKAVHAHLYYLQSDKTYGEAFAPNACSKDAQTPG